MPEREIEGFKFTRIGSTTPEREASSVYGEGKLREILREKAKQFLTRSDVIPPEIRSRIPSYSVDDWRKESPIWYTPKTLNLSGFTYSNKPDIYLSAQPNKQATKATIIHELTHQMSWPRRKGVAREDADALAEAEERLSLGQRAQRALIRVGKKPGWVVPKVPKEYAEESDRRLFEDVRSTDEVIPYMTTAVRAFYRREGRPVSSPEDVRKAIDYFEEDEVAGDKEDLYRAPSGKLKADALRSLPYIEDLGMLLVKNTVRKPATIGSNITLKGIV